MASQGENVHRVDLHVGARVRMRRKFLGKSQSDMANSIKVTFQQVQKYERGSNRISASKLFEISRVLKVNVGYFFEGLGEGENSEGVFEPGNEQIIHSYLMSGEGIELAEAFLRIRISKHRRRVIELIRALAEDDNNAYG